MYKSPIECFFTDTIEPIVKEIHEQQENYVVNAVRNMGIDVDKEQLVRALSFDRHQYEAGYRDGRASVGNRMSKSNFDDIIQWLKYKYCNCMNTCEECSTNHPCECHAKVDLFDVLKVLESERARFYGKDNSDED